ncbi:MAG: 5'-nucleotidase C-terminal domain-containing protein [Aquiluna sp.]|nr:5'-nucleotidase C-terminal domain-containing protein [Aquiluna sp.]MCF8545113.1 5'-nucleotidase C-terminal domain-containing protein [Aquiluna sp.]
MNTIRQRRTKFGLAVTTAFMLGFASLSAPAVSVETYAAPAAPAKVTTIAADGGFRVFWKAVTANPGVSYYIVSGGEGSCPVIVPGTATSAFMYALDETALNVTVQAVSNYGISATASSGQAIAPISATDLPLKSVQLLQLSDFHGQIEANRSFGAALLALNFDAERANNAATFAMASGDSIGAAPPISSQFAELPTIKAFNEVGFDVATFGNHEHDRSLEHLRFMIRYSDFEWVTSNYSTLRGLNAGNGARAKSYTIIEKDGVKVGFVGMNTSQTVEQVFPGNLDFTYSGKKQTVVISDDSKAVSNAAAAARAAGADMVVALIHEGWNTNTAGKAVGPLVDFANEISNVDVFYGGHSHQTYSSVQNGKLTAMVKNAGAEYNRSQVCVNTSTNKVLGSSNELVTTSNAPVKTGADVATAAVVKSYKDQLTAKFDVAIGQVEGQTPIAGSPPVQRSGEHAFGNWSADTVRAKYDTDFALVNGGGIRDTFPSTNYKPSDLTLSRPGASNSSTVYDVTLGDVYTVQPFGNSFSVIEITGATLWSALENGVSNYPADGRWPHVSGLKFTVDVTKAVGSRIQSVTTTAGATIAKDSKKYSLATTDFIAKGGDGYNMFDVSKLQVRDIDAIVLIDALKADAANGKVTQMKLDGRVTVIK